MSEPSEFERDVETLVAMFREDSRPGPEQLDAAGRVVRHTLVNLASVAESLRRIAAAQEVIARTPQRQPLRSDPGW